MKKLVLSIFILSIFLASHSFAQDSALVEAAKKEKARRSALEKPVKKFTNKDIEDFKDKHKDEWGKESAPPPPEEKKAETKKKPELPADQDPEKEEYWRAKYAAAAQRLKDAEENANRLQSEINALTQAFYAESDGIAQRPLIEHERTQKIEELQTAKLELNEAKQAMADLEDEARMAGAPPGWVRD